MVEIVFDIHQYKVVLLNTHPNKPNKASAKIICKGGPSSSSVSKDKVIIFFHPNGSELPENEVSAIGIYGYNDHFEGTMHIYEDQYNWYIDLLRNEIEIKGEINTEDPNLHIIYTRYVDVSWGHLIGN